MKAAWWGIGLIVALLLMAAFHPVVAAEPSGGHQAVQKGDCAMCHVTPGVAAPDRAGSCVSCHEWVRSVSQNPTARAKALEFFPLWTRYERNVVSYFAVPDLGVAAARLDPAWIQEWLGNPHDLRPAMPETMVRLGLSPGELGEIAAWFGAQQQPVPATPAPSTTNIEAGKSLFATRGCIACHSFGAVYPGPGIASAPDLQHSRKRMKSDRIVAWIQNPTALHPKAVMPNLGISLADAILLRDFLVLADPGGSTAKAPPKLAKLPRPSCDGKSPPSSSPTVRWEQVESQVFGKICVHCHMDPSQNEGRAGPGNAGGFGWAATGIELQSREGVAAHAPAILDAMLRRRDELPRDVVLPGQVPADIQRPAKPGMPLGLPAIPDTDIQMVATWMSEGCPE